MKRDPRKNWNVLDSRQKKKEGIEIDKKKKKSIKREEKMDL